MFVGSPVEEDEKTLVKLAKKLKKNNIAVDVINFGEETENTTRLEAFVAAVNNNDNRYEKWTPYLKMMLDRFLEGAPKLTPFSIVLYLETFF